ncbi:hypothetical protein KPL71_023660 [Citrus sinensis]|uniref:Uncharacterized protein n=1 Tax=Citrus sinensis TaxID=2711 RepID=A0ACB8IKN4_CITSI|nr:hypothetical protein KPL71_023660 [Citrus sinensis]
MNVCFDRGDASEGIAVFVCLSLIMEGIAVDECLFALVEKGENRIQSSLDESDHFGVTTRPEESVSAPNSSFTEGVATKDIHIDPFTSLSIRIFLPESALNPPESDSSPQSNAEVVLPRNLFHL